MFDYTQHGAVDTHSYRGYYDAQAGSTTQCAFCGRVIRYCYTIHNQHGKTFVVGSCDFSQYRGTQLFRQLKAAQILQEALLKNIRRDLKHFNDKAEVREHRKAWAQARRSGEKLVRTYVLVNGTWLPKELFELQAAAGQKPRRYKRQTAALRWYDQQTEKLIALTHLASSI
jgi:hypothetical protein